MAAKKHITLLHITDLHLFGNVATKFLDFAPYASLRAIATDIQTRIMSVQQLDAILLTGDISQDFSPNSYKLAADILAEFSCPIIVTSGNHDEVDLFAKMLRDNKNLQASKKIIIGNWRILMLNSHYPAHVAGFLDGRELEFLRCELEDDPKTATVVFLHHHVLPTDSKWLDALKLSNAKQFLKIIDKHSNVKAVFCGHVHQEYTTTRQNVAYFATPAICWQFARSAPTFALDDQNMPGYRLIELYATEELKTAVIRLPFNKKFVPNLGKMDAHYG